MKIQEYELVDQSDNRERLEQQQQQRDQSKRFTDQELGSSVPSNSASEVTPSARSSVESESSGIFDNIDTATARSGESDDNFYQDMSFQSIWSRYGKQGGRSTTKSWQTHICRLLTSAAVILWALGLFVYSQGNHQKLIDQFSRPKPIIYYHGQNLTVNEYDPTFKNLTMDTFYKGTYRPQRIELQWLDIRQYPTKAKDIIGGKSGGGYYITKTSTGAFIVQQINNHDKVDVFIESPKFAYENDFFKIEDVRLNPAKPIDQLTDNWHVVITDTVTQWRHSTFALYWLFNPVTKEYTPIQPPASDTGSKSELFKSRSLFKLHFVKFSPNGNFIAFGFNHDLYVQNLKTGEVKQVTSTGSKDVYNGKPDWVYEEDVLAYDKFFWWSPDEEHLVYVSLNDTQVNEYELDYYVKGPEEIANTFDEPTEANVPFGDESLNQYPVKTSIKYPKPGSPNPIPSIFHYHVTDSTTKELVVDDEKLGRDYIVYAGQWLSDKAFMLRLSDRTSTETVKKVFSPKAEDGAEFKTVSQVNTHQSFHGWMGKTIPLVALDDGSYVDLVVQNNRSHLALFESPSSPSPSTFLTESQEWEVLDSHPITHDKVHNVLYFLSSKRSAMDAHLMSVDLSGDHAIREVTSTSAMGKYDIQFSNDGQYLNLNYAGPNVPWQKLVNMGELHESEATVGAYDDEILAIPFFNNVDTLENNLAKSNLPTKKYGSFSFDPGNATVNVIEILPPNFNPKNKGMYPIFVNVYGGPGSQMADMTFDMGFVETISATLNAIVLVIDPRGTGPSWASRSWSCGQLGYWEPRDIIKATKDYIQVNKEVINQDRVAIWGWSYGGFTTLKVLELDNGEVFKYGMAVAPVTNWLFYDSIFTERYMSTPSDETVDAYTKISRVNNFANFKKTKRFLLMQGSSDDNVHMQNLYWLLDKFDQAKVENYDVHVFPDSDHSMSYHGAFNVVFDKLIHWLGDAFSGKFDALV